MNDLTIMRTIAQFDTFDARLVAAYCRVGEKDVDTFLSTHHHLFERAAGRHSAASPRLRIRDHESFQSLLVELSATERAAESAEPVAGITEQLQVLESHLLVATLAVQKAAEAPRAFRSKMAAEVEVCLEESLSHLRAATHPQRTLEPLLPSLDPRVNPHSPAASRTSIDSPEPGAQRRIWLARHAASPASSRPQRRSAWTRFSLPIPTGLLRHFGMF